MGDVGVIRVDQYQDIRIKILLNFYWATLRSVCFSYRDVSSYFDLLCRSYWLQHNFIVVTGVSFFKDRFYGLQECSSIK